jgi:hypothetical protein
MSLLGEWKENGKKASGEKRKRQNSDNRQGMMINGKEESRRILRKIHA